MSAFILAGSRQKVSDKNRHHEPGEYRNLQPGRNTARGEINRKSRDRDQRAQKPRRDERAMPPRRQRIMLDGRMNEAVDIVVKRLNETQSNPLRQPALADTLPICRTGIVSDPA